MDKDINQIIEYALSLITNGDEKGIDIIYKTMGKVMFVIAKGITNDNFISEDVIQDSLLKIVQSATKYKKGSNGYAWICKITKNTALNTIKTLNNNPTIDIDEFKNISDDNDLTNKSHTQLLVEQLMNSLTPPIVKQMIYMKYFLDMSVREIAKEIKKSKSYVSKEIQKAEEKMKNLIK